MISNVIFKDEQIVFVQKCTFFATICTFLQQYASSDHIGDNDNHDKYTDHEENNIDNVVVVVLLK